MASTFPAKGNGECNRRLDFSSFLCPGGFASLFIFPTHIYHSSTKDNQSSAAAAEAILAGIGTMTVGDNSDGDDGNCSSMEHFLYSSDKESYIDTGR